MEWLPALITALTALVKETGFVNAMFLVFFVLAHIAIFALYRGRINDRQKEIDRLAKDNREYRMRFLAFLDRKFSDGDEHDN